ncbi:MAG TPA: AAA family ATPase [Gemmatimonadaceae bacterium]|nr:AAA family ATPase [Gemmatimonadaceae bacterium]
MIRSTAVCPVSVGREEAIRALNQRLDRAVAGDGSFLLISGNAGVGKSRLVKELKREAAIRGVRVIEGRCSSTESSVPYAPLMDALRFRIERGEGEEAAKVLGPLRSILAPIFPQLDKNTEPQARPSDHHSDRPFELIFSVLARLAQQEPMLLVLEDLHWADPTSLEVLHHLAHRAPQLPLLVVATYRSDEIHALHPLRRLLGSLARDRVGEEMRIEPLDRDQTAEMLRCMLDAEPDPAFTSVIWRRCEGNPFFVEELLTVLMKGGPVVPDANAAEALDRARLPATVSESVLSRVHALGPSAVEALSVAAVIGRSFEFDDLCVALGISEEDLTDVIEQLVAQQLLREEPGADGDRYAFPHALMQEALYESIISRRRRLLHRQVASAIEQRGEESNPTRLDQLAYHFRLGGDHARAYRYSRLAGDEAVRLRAWDDAAEHYENALASLEHLNDDGARAAELLERLAAVAWRQSRAASGRQYVEEALRLRRLLGHHEETARLLRRLAAMRVEEGDQSGAAGALNEAMKLIGDYPDSRELGALYDDLGRLSLARGELDEAKSLLVQGLTHASRDSQNGEDVLAMVSLAEVSVVTGHLTAGVTQLDVALSMLRERRLPFERLTRVYAVGVRTLLRAHEYERALSWAETAIALCQKQGVVGLDALFRALRAAVLTITADAEDALVEAIAAVDELRRTERAELRDALRVLGFVHRARGELEAARRAYEEAAGQGESSQSIGLALVAFAEGHIEEAALTLEAAYHEVPVDQPLLARQLLPYTVEALIAVGRVTDANAMVRSATDLPDARAGAAQLSHARGLVCLAQGRGAQARDQFTIAVSEWDKLGNRLEYRRVRVSLLEATLIADGPTAGLALGRRLLEELGRPLLPREREVVRRILRRAGVRTPAQPASGDARRSKLTSREEAVLLQVAEGRTNRQIATALGIAEKTVSVHVSHILAKLECKTRTQAARFVPR